MGLGLEPACHLPQRCRKAPQPHNGWAAQNAAAGLSVHCSRRRKSYWIICLVTKDRRIKLSDARYTLHVDATSLSGSELFILTS